MMTRLPWLLTVSLAAGCTLHDSNHDTGGPLNLAVAGDYVIAARGTAGIDVVRASTGAVVSHVEPRGEVDAYDDVAADGAVVLAHSVGDERVSSFVLTLDGELTPVDADLEVPSGPYSGVSLAGGWAVVSGGTCAITVLDVEDDGHLARVGQFEAFRGQPDVTMLPGGAGALLSTHFSGDEDAFIDGQEFGVSAMSLAAQGVVDPLGLPGAGFSDGGGTPASWPVRATVAGDLAYVAHGGGLEILRVAADLTLARVAHLDLPFAAVDVAVDGDEAFVVGVPAQVAVVDVADPAAPRFDRTLPLVGDGSMPTAVALAGGAIYVAANAGGLLRLPR